MAAAPPSLPTPTARSTSSASARCTAPCRPATASLATPCALGWAGLRLGVAGLGWMVVVAVWVGWAGLEAVGLHGSVLSSLTACCRLDTHCPSWSPHTHACSAGVVKTLRFTWACDYPRFARAATDGGLASASCPGSCLAIGGIVRPTYGNLTESGCNSTTTYSVMTE